MILRGVAVSLYVFFLSLAAAHAEGEPPIDLGAARQAFEHARKLSADDEGRLWGRALYGPMLFVDPGTRFIVANQKDDEGHLTESAGVFVGTLPQEENFANTAFTWAGVHWTMVMWPLSGNRYARGRLMMHECFHRIQDTMGLPASNPANNHLDSQDGRTWLRMEWRALVEALIQSDRDQRDAIEDALVFRSHRRSLIPGAAAEERQLEMNEGLAEYTGFKLSGWPGGILADRAAVKIERSEQRESYIRSFAYATGPAYGLLLDQVDQEWRRGLGPDSDLGEILASAISFDLPADLAQEALQRAADYGGKNVIASEARRAEAKLLAAEKHKKRYFGDPVLILPLDKGMRYSFNPNAMEPLGELGTVFETTRVSAEWGILEVTAGALLSRDANGSMSEARVPAPAEHLGSSISGDGWTLELAKGWRIVDGPRAGDYTVNRDE